MVSHGQDDLVSRIVNVRYLGQAPETFLELASPVVGPAQDADPPAVARLLPLLGHFQQPVAILDPVRSQGASMGQVIRNPNPVPIAKMLLHLLALLSVSGLVADRQE